MTATNLIDGRAIAELIHAETIARIAALKVRGVTPGLAFVRVGEDPASKVYVGMKEKTSKRVAIESVTHVLEEKTSEADLLALLQELNRAPKVHGILVQAPLPRHINSARVYSSVAPEKDVDGFNPVNVGKLMLGDRTGFAPCTPAGVIEMLEPMAAMLMQKADGADATVTVCHSRTRDIKGHCLRADILIAAMGVPEFVKADMVKPGAIVIDVGVNRVPDPSSKIGSRIVGDVDFARVQPIAGRITPNPGGVGPMTIAMLLKNTVRAAEMAA